MTGLNLFGYFIAFLAVCWYNWQKLQSMKAQAMAQVRSRPGGRLPQILTPYLPCGVLGGAPPGTGGGVSSGML